MFQQTLRPILLSTLFLIGAGSWNPLPGQDTPETTALQLSSTSQPANIGLLTESSVTVALDALDRWIGNGPNGNRWRRFLQSSLLRAQIERGSQADPAVVTHILQRYQSQASGLDRPPFLAVRKSLSHWLAALRHQYAGDLPQLAWASRGDYRPIAEQQILALRHHLLNQAHILDQALASQGNQFAQQWKHYLKWDRLAPQLSPAKKMDRRAVVDLDQVLKQFRRNQPGLERPEFTRTAEAIEQLRVAIPWAMAARARDPSKDYQRLLSELKEQLQRHLAAASSETEWKVGRILGLIDQLGQSALLVDAVHKSLVQPNLLLGVSEAFIQRAGRRPVRNTQPVHDFILGTTITGTAQTAGSIRIRTLPCSDAIQLEVQLTGDTRSHTRGYQGPIRIRSSGNTHFVASQQISLDADSFRARSAVVHANTQTRIHSIQKMGGPLGHRLIERIAWNQAGRSKGCAEQIASRHAEARIAAGFDEQLTAALNRARTKYDQQIRAPLIRRNMLPTRLEMSSQPDCLRVEALLASRHQLAASRASPRLLPTGDLTLRVHQSAVSNYLAMVMDGGTIEQEFAGQPPKMSGNLPPWMAKLSLAERFQTKPPVAGPRSGDPTEAVDSLPRDQGDFQPWSMTLNAERPVSVQFTNQQLVLRMRAARLTSDENEYKNWDFIIRYDVLPQGNSILLRRSGKIEVFPTGFDPRWDKKMSSAKSGFRSTLARNMNARADRGESFPAEIPIQPIRLPKKLGIPGELTLQQLDCDQHWLTLSWALP